MRKEVMNVADKFYIKMTGQKSGAVKGGVTQKGREDLIAGLAMSWSMESPRNAQSGLPTGQAIHKPLVFTKAWDKSTPVLQNIMFTNENLSECVLTFWASAPSAGSAMSGVGTEAVTMTIKLVNANIASYQAYTASPDQLNQFDASELEDISLTYESITWTWATGGITSTDDWETRT
jgi:type VI secretion system secreted protein Hcp